MFSEYFADTFSKNILQFRIYVNETVFLIMLI